MSKKFNFLSLIDRLIAEAPSILPFNFPADVKKGQLLQVSCIVTTGDEPLTLAWYKDGAHLISSDKFLINSINNKMSFLILTDVGFEHSGSYSCIASNAAGESEASAELYVQGYT